jgi:hypothetical protein
VALPSRINFGPFVRIICGVPTGAEGIQVISFVTPQAGPVPRELIVPDPLTIVKFESTLSSDGAIAAIPVLYNPVAGTGTVLIGASPIAESTKVKLISMLQFLPSGFLVPT